MAAAQAAIVRLFRKTQRPTLSPALPPQGGGSALLTPAEITALAAQARLLARLPQRREVHDHHAGDWPSARLGRGLDFEESRPYAPGDDIRDMDWRTTARLSHLYVKTYREERQPVLHLVVDRGPAMRFGTRRRLKATQAARLAALVAFAAAERNAAVSASFWEAQDHDLPPAHGRHAALAIARAAAAPCPPLPPRGRGGGATPANPPAQEHRLARLAADLPRGARVLLLTDLSWLEDRHAPALARLGERCDVQVLQIVDAAERALPDIGLAQVLDLARARPRWLDTRASAAAHAQAFQARQEYLTGLLARAGIAHRLVGAEEEALLPCLTLENHA
ncbi:MAG: DUF58 domain-containing protein [Betaproteobacteria bacterium]|nr:DUF58 domain-containing protein [Betaproteobacteria bacterium]